VRRRTAFKTQWRTRAHVKTICGWFGDEVQIHTYTRTYVFSSPPPFNYFASQQHRIRHTVYCNNNNNNNLGMFFWFLRLSTRSRMCSDTEGKSYDYVSQMSVSVRWPSASYHYINHGWCYSTDRRDIFGFFRPGRKTILWIRFSFCFRQIEYCRCYFLLMLF